MRRDVLRAFIFLFAVGCNSSSCKTDRNVCADSCRPGGYTYESQSKWGGYSVSCRCAGGSDAGSGDERR